MSQISEAIQNLRDKLGSLGKKGGGGDSGKSGGFDAKKVLAWIKSNPVSVASIGVMVVVPVAAWWVAGDIKAERVRLAESRAQEWANLEKLEKASIEITLPGRAAEAMTGTVSSKSVNAYKALAARLKSDAVSAQQRAREINQGGRTKLIADVRVTKDNSSVIAEEVFDAVRARATAVLKELKVLAPPGDDRLIDDLQRRQDAFIAAERKTDRKSLDADQLKRLQSSLAETRLQLYADTAGSASFYGDLGALDLPGSAGEAGSPPSEPRMFEWQWRLWVQEDVLRALADANTGSRSVIEAPVKRIVSIAVGPDMAMKRAGPAEGEGGEAPPAEGGDGSVPPADGAAPSEPGLAPPAPSYPPIDLKAPVEYDFSRTFTGRVSNALYDVRNVTLRVVVSTSRMPALLNALAKRNFMTVIGMEVRPADAFDAADLGYIYGAEPVSEVTMVVETVWLKSWLARLMPPEMQKAKGTDGKTSDDVAAEQAAAEPSA
jgi:hypothetical protein